MSSPKGTREPNAPLAHGAPRVSAPAGLCQNCVQGRRITSAKGSVFWLCQQGDLPRYPRLPVVLCPHFQARPPETIDGSRGVE